MKGKLYLVPVTLGDQEYMKVIPVKVLELTKVLRFFIVEDIRSARRYLRLIDRSFPIDETVFFELNEHTPENGITQYLDPAIKGADIGLMSEAGLPCIADPGARIVEIAHRKGITVVPLSGPSSIILSLIASGFNGQSFTFHGYLPVKQNELNARIRELEKSASGGITQIFMETPYRSQKMLEAIISVCDGNTRLCIAADITLPVESVVTKKISEWKRSLPVLKDRLVVFLLG